MGARGGAPFPPEGKKLVYPEEEKRAVEEDDELLELHVDPAGQAAPSAMATAAT